MIIIKCSLPWWFILKWLSGIQVRVRICLPIQEDMGSIHESLGTKIPHAMEKRGLCATATDPHSRAHALQEEATRMRSPCTVTKRRPCSAQLESLQTIETQHSHKVIHSLIKNLNVKLPQSILVV